MEHQKKVRTYICPDRLRCGSIKRKPEASKYEPAKKKYCQSCLNTSLVDTNEIAASVERLISSTCDQCGVLWVDIKEDPRAHADRHLKDCVASIGIDLNAKKAAGKYNKKQHESKAFNLYYTDNLYVEGSKIASNFSNMTKRDQDKYTAVVDDLESADLNLLAGTVYEYGDDRPPANMGFVPSFLLPRGSETFAFHTITSSHGTFTHIADTLKDKTVSHSLYQIDLPLTTPEWGTQVYLCYTCTDPLDIDYESEDLPFIKCSKVCSCSKHVPEAYPDREEDPPVYVSPQPDAMLKVAATINVQLSKPTPLQTAVGYNGDNKFLYQCNSVFCGYVIHAKCCTAPLKRN